VVELIAATTTKTGLKVRSACAASTSLATPSIPTGTTPSRRDASPTLQVSVAIIEAPSLIHARIRAALEGMNAGETFAEGHQLDADHAAWGPSYLKSNPRLRVTCRRVVLLQRPFPVL